MFSTLWKIFTFTLVSLLKVYFIVKAFFFKCLLRKKKTILTFQPPTWFPCENLSQPASPACTRSPYEQLLGGSSGGKAEGRHGKQGRKKKKKKNRGKRAGSENWRPGSMHSQLRPSAQREAGSGGHRTASGSAPGHWLSEGRSEAKVVPAVPPAHRLPSTPTDSTLNKQLFGKCK